MVFTSMFIGKLIGLGITAVLARLLSPEDFGLLQMVFTLTVLLTVFSDMGLSTATIQKAKLDHSEASAAFWLNLLFGCIVCILTLAAAPVLAWFYQHPALRNLTFWCALGFPITALGTQHIAQMTRRLEFRWIATCELASSVVGGVVGIVMAWRGYGVHALVAQLLAAAATKAGLAWFVSGFVPSFPRHTPELRSMLRFGGYLTAFNMVNYFARNLDNVLVGRMWGAASLGLYAKAYSLMMYPITLVSGPIARVTIPTLSRLQDDLPRMRAAYLQVLQLIGFCTFPLMGFLVVAAPDVILLVFGAKWADAIPSFRILCIAGFFQGIYNATGQVFVAAGRTDRMFRCGLLMTVALVIGFAVGSVFGPLGVAVAYAVVMTIGLLPYLSYTYSTIGMRLGTVVSALAPAFAASLFASGVTSLFLLGFADAWPAELRLVCCFVAMGAAYLGFIAVFRRPLLVDVIDRTLWRVVPRAGNHLAVPQQ